MTIINLLVHFPLGTMLHDVFEEMKTEESTFKILDKQIQELRPKNVLQVLMDSHPS